MRCPVDNETLVIAERGGVEIDYCPRCRGVWLDRGELDKIIERDAGGRGPSASDVGPVALDEPRRSRSADGYQSRRRERDDRDDRDDDDDDDDDRHRRRGDTRRRKSILSEIFDF